MDTLKFLNEKFPGMAWTSTNEFQAPKESCYRLVYLEGLRLTAAKYDAGYNRWYKISGFPIYPEYYSQLPIEI